jgi:hypothetical protein
VCYRGVVPLDINAYKTGNGALGARAEQVDAGEDEEREKAKQDFDDRVKAANALSRTTSLGEGVGEQTDADHRRAGQSGVRNTINYEEREVADEDEANKVLKEVKEKVEELKKIAEEPTEEAKSEEANTRE